MRCSSVCGPSQTGDQIVIDRGDVATAFAGAAHIASGRYDSPYQMHGPFGPTLRDSRCEGRLGARYMLGAEHLRNSGMSVASVTHLPLEQVTVRYFESSGTYGRSCHADVAQSAAIMSQEAGAPVRLQFMRWDEFGWEALPGSAHGRCEDRRRRQWQDRRL